jgi:2,4-dienoyl-CoA reductase-like NADH-dependent reductase (Old Yellow Enzyme family)/thioredoxin reductase
MSEGEEKFTKGLSRRDFLKTAATVSAAGVLGAYVPKEPLLKEPATVASAGNQIQNAEAQNGEVRSESAVNVKIEKLLEPGMIGKVKTRNRMIKTAAYGWILWDNDKSVFRAEGLGYYEAIAKGGVGLMVMEDPAFRPDTIGRPFYDDKYIDSEKQLVDLIHKHGCPTFAQLTDFRPLMGIAASSEFDYPAKLDMNNAMPKALTLDDIKQNTEMIAQAALRCKKAGYEGVELKTGCTHMFATFASRFWNKRTDDYGAQTFENRARIITDMIKAIKGQCGSDFAVGVLLNGTEINVFELGNNSELCTVDESVELAKLYEKAGADSILVRSHSVGNHINGFFPDFYYMFGKEANTGYGKEMDIKQYWPDFITKYGGAGAFIDTAAKFKKALSIPIITVGSMDPRLIPDVVEGAVRDGKIDFVALTRPLTADPDLPNKMAAGKLDDIRPCAHCITCFPMTRCRVNAASTRINGPDMPEGYEVQAATTKKKVLVVGGGPAGLEAARVAALRGHQVCLYEKSSRLGGLMPLAAMVKGEHEKVMDFVTYLSSQVKKLGMDVRLGNEVTPAVVDQIKPDVVIVATGSGTSSPNIPGVNNSKVISSDSLHGLLEAGLNIVDPMTLHDLTNLYMPIGKKVIIIGGQIQGLQLAEFLSQRGKDVTIIDEDKPENLGLNLPDYVKERLVLFIHSHGVKTNMGVTYNEINDQGMTITTGFGLKRTIPADSIILALPAPANTSLADSLKGKVAEVYAIGDCKKPGVMVDAVEAGNLTARKV